MTFSFTTWWKTTEADVISVIAKIKADEQIAESDITAALNWVAGEVPNIVSGLQVALGLAQAVGVVTAPELAAATAAVEALQALAAAHNASVTAGDKSLATDAKSVVAGYVAYTQAQAAVNAAKSTAAQAAISN
jgi:hypothetical protein